MANYLAIVYAIAFLAFAITIQLDIKTAEVISRFLVGIIGLPPSFRIPLHEGFIAGPWSRDVDQALVDLSVWFAVIGGIASGVLFSVSFDLLKNPTNAAKHFIQRNNWNQYSAELIRIRVGLFALWLLFTSVVLNGITGTVTIHVKDALSAWFFSMVLASSGPLVVVVALLQISLFALDFDRLLSRKT